MCLTQKNSRISRNQEYKFCTTDELSCINYVLFRISVFNNPISRKNPAIEKPAQTRGR